MASSKQELMDELKQYIKYQNEANEYFIKVNLQDGITFDKNNYGKIKNKINKVLSDPISKTNPAVRAYCMVMLYGIYKLYGFDMDPYSYIREKNKIKELSLHEDKFFKASMIRYGIFFREFAYDKELIVRFILATEGYHLDILVNDPVPIIRILACKTLSEELSDMQETKIEWELVQ